MDLRSLALLLVLPLVLAGCAAPAATVAPQSAPADAAAPPPDAAEVAPGVFARTGAYDATLDASVGAPVPCVDVTCLHAQVCVDACVNGVRQELSPAKAAVALLVELRWEGPLDLDLRAYPDSAALFVTTEGPHLPERAHFVDEDGAPGAPDGVARVLVEDASLFPAGEPWAAVVTAKGAAAQVSFSLRVTEFFGGAPPEGWTAFEGEKV